jgi:hypothetical protein
MTAKRQLGRQKLKDLSDSVHGDPGWLRGTDLSVVGEEHLREMSARLRRLLIDGTLQKLRRARGLKRENPESPLQFSLTLEGQASFMRKQPAIHVRDSWWAV